MEAKVAQWPQISTWMEMEKTGRRPSGSLQFTRQRPRGQQRVQMLISTCLQPTRTSNKQRPNVLAVSCSYKNFPGICSDTCLLGAKSSWILCCFIEFDVLHSHRKFFLCPFLAWSSSCSNKENRKSGMISVNEYGSLRILFWALRDANLFRYIQVTEVDITSV